MLQKYYALFFNDYQQWFEYRRTGLPRLPRGQDLQNGGIMPVRFKYPLVVQTNNADQLPRGRGSHGRRRREHQSMVGKIAP